MNKKFLRLGELICVLCLIGFVILTSSTEKKSDVPIKDIYTAVNAVCDLDGLKTDDVLQIKKQFSLDTDSIENFVYLHSESVMDVRELLIISLDDLSLQKSFEEKIKVYVEQKQDIFESYAPREEKMLSSHVLISKGGYVLFYVGDTPQEVTDAFRKSLS